MQISARKALLSAAWLVVSWLGPPVLKHFGIDLAAIADSIIRYLFGPNVHPVTIGDLQIGFFGLAVVGLCFIYAAPLSRKWKKPHTLHTEKPSPPPARSPNAAPKLVRDVSLCDAIWRAHLGRWERLKYTDPSIGSEGRDRLGEIVTREIRQYASDKRLPIWGKHLTHDLWRPIPANFWSDHQLNWISFTRAESGDEKLETEPMMNEPRQPPSWNTLMTSKAAVDALWPAKASTSTLDEQRRSFVESAFAKLDHDSVTWLRTMLIAGRPSGLPDSIGQSLWDAGLMERDFTGWKGIKDELKDAVKIHFERTAGRKDK